MVKPLSELLMELAKRVKRVEDSLTETRERSQTVLQERRQELEQEFDRKKNEFDEVMAQLADAPRNWWSDTKGLVERQVATMRNDFEKWQSEVREKSAQRAADYAEENATVAMKMADYFLNAAEWAAVQARLARAEADELVEKN